MAGVAELARMLFAANTILERASSAVGLSKRAALALAILHLELNVKESMSNQDLHDKFLKYNVSTGLSAKKDASAAKSELLNAKHIEIRGNVSIFGLTTQGRDVVLKMHEAVNEAIKELALSDDERDVLRELIQLPEPEPPAKPPVSETSGKRVRQKSF